MLIAKKALVAGACTALLSRMGGVSYGSYQELAMVSAVAGLACVGGAMLSADLKKRFADEEVIA